MRNLKQFLAALPHSPGVYQMQDDRGVVIYIGKAKNLKNRLSSYFTRQTKDPKTTSLVQAVHDITVTTTASESEAILLECTLIKKHLPKYNILLRDDKSFPYIVLSEHAFPRLELYRGTRKKAGRLFGPYPDTRAVRETIQLLQKLFRLRTCTDSYFHSRKRPCLLYQLQRCNAPCVNNISQEDYESSVGMTALFLEGKNDVIIAALIQRMEQESGEQHYEKAAFYRDQIHRLRELQNKQLIFSDVASLDVIGFASGAGSVAIQLLSIRHGQLIGSRSYFPKLPLYWEINDLISAFITQHYLNERVSVDIMPDVFLLPFSLQDKEALFDALSMRRGKSVKSQTGKQGIKKQWLMMAMQNAEESLGIYLSTKSNIAARLKALQDVLLLTSPPKRIECFDISHTQGEATVGACVVFDHMGPCKEDYRRYNMQTLTHGNDLAAMRETLLRRYRHVAETKEKCPDLIIIDGGEQQLTVASEVLSLLSLAIPLISVSKGVGRRAGFEVIHERNKPAYRLPVHSPALHLIQHLRDEAHRFAITGHRKRRDKMSIQSTLESIPGIGAKKRRDLLRYFGGIQGLARASLERLMEVPGIDLVLAERIFTALHDATL